MVFGRLKRKVVNLYTLGGFALTSLFATGCPWDLDYDVEYTCEQQCKHEHPNVPLTDPLFANCYNECTDANDGETAGDGSDPPDVDDDPLADIRDFLDLPDDESDTFRDSDTGMDYETFTEIIETTETDSDTNQDNLEDVCEPFPWYLDGDGDGYGYRGSLVWACTQPDDAHSVTNADDCNDNDYNINPGEIEICDGIDNDCNEETLDGSGEETPLNSIQGGVCENSFQSCIEGSWTDFYEEIEFYQAHDEAETLCDGLDNNCDSFVDEGLRTLYFYDGDHDSYGNSNIFVEACQQPPNYVDNNFDCNDDINSIHPGADDVCNGIDDDCNPNTSDGSGEITPLNSNQEGVCENSYQICVAGDWIDSDYEEIEFYQSGIETSCDNLDNNCNGSTDEGCDDDLDGYCDQEMVYLESNLCFNGENDCDDTEETIYPGAPELCDHLDNNCNDEVDEFLGGRNCDTRNEWWTVNGVEVGACNYQTGEYEITDCFDPDECDLNSDDPTGAVQLEAITCGDPELHDVGICRNGEQSRTCEARTFVDDNGIEYQVAMIILHDDCNTIGPESEDLNDNGVFNPSDYDRTNNDCDDRTDDEGFAEIRAPAEGFMSDGNRIFLDDYEIMIFPVTNRQYKECVDNGFCNPPSLESATREFYYGNSEYDDFPVINLGWRAARRYCVWAYGTTAERVIVLDDPEINQQFKGDLPTLTQHKFAAMGVEDRTYPWGDTDPHCDEENGYWANFIDCGLGDTTAVDAYPLGATPEGVYDLSGNVWGWALDWYNQDHVYTGHNPLGPLTGVDGEKTIVGGSYDSLPDELRNDHSDHFHPRDSSDKISSRCVINPNID